jgi:hypothetical protein
MGRIRTHKIEAPTIVAAPTNLVVPRQLSLRAVSNTHEREAQKGKREMRAHDEEELLWPFGDIIGFDEEDEDDDEEGEESDEDEESEEESEEEDEDDEDEEDEDDKSKSKKSTEGLKSALRKERMERKRLARELKKLQKAVPTPGEKPKKDGDDEEDEKSAEAARKAEEAEKKAERLAAQFATNAVDTVILKYASDFKDVNDVLQFVNRKEIDVDQDDDDPSVIEVDEESVKDAVKALRKSKPYLLKTEAERTKSGSKFNGSKKSKNTISDEVLRKKYSALRR